MPIVQPPSNVQHFIQQLSQPQPMRRGSLGQRYVACGKANCSCADNPVQRHGPYFSLTCKKSGQSRYRLLNSEQAKLARTQIEAGRNFRKSIDDYWDACERWADTQLENPKAADEAAKKGASKNSSKKEFSRK